MIDHKMRGRWDAPRPHLDASQRLHSYGPLQPMPDDRPRFWNRLGKRS